MDTQYFYNTNEINLSIYLKNAIDSEVEFTAYKKTVNGLIETNQIYSRNKLTGSVNGQSFKLYLSDDITSGIYQLQFKNYDKTVIINIVVKKEEVK